ncbi:DoxX family protein [[Mycobacterium] wendilense]|uniref:DoxX family protein n=1 Tax=[Mycobacterium] wendilense TaxID=3064284 RepID=A0ABM9M954_9MYCO|nr:DoxX family protein [Mycolicibacterium sp. MU0050]CAJ1579476.1 DoxX family protein [Mycolicibacterium sp. MU0050]
MNTALWIVTVVLAVGFLAGGAALILLPKDRYRALGANQHWVDDFGATQLKVIGAIKATGALGLVLPAGVVPMLVPLAATGLALFMSGAATTRFRRNEWRYFVGDLVFIGLFGFVAWGRFALEPLT